MAKTHSFTQESSLVLLGLVLIYATTNGVLTYTLPLLHPALIEEFGWNEAQVTEPAAWYLFITAVTSPIAGFLLDRFPAKRVISVGLLLIGLGFFLYAQVTELQQLKLVYLLMGTSLSLCGLVSNMLILTRWFDHKRGLATGILLTASSLGGVVYPLLMGYGLESYGWRHSMTLLAIVFASVTLLPLWLFVRNRPADATPDIGVAAPRPAGITLSKAIQEPRFYLVAIATASVWFGLFAMLNHQTIHIARGLGLGKHLSTIMATFALSSVVGKLVFGYLSDRLDKPFTMMLAVATFGFAVFFLRNIATDRELLFVYAVLAGIGFSGTFTMSQILIADLYAGPSYGKILGTFIMLDTLAGAAGTVVAGRIRQNADSYAPVFDILILGCAISIVSLILLRRIKKTP
ncbi:MAG: MFS transporter [Pseudomonadota bacterium]